MPEFCGIELRHEVINASGTFDAIAALRAFGDALLERFPFAAFVSKTVTLAPRQGNPPPRLWEQPGGLINSIGLPNKGLEGYLRETEFLLMEGATPGQIDRAIEATGMAMGPCRMIDMAVTLLPEPDSPTMPST